MLNRGGEAKTERERVAQVLMMSLTGDQFGRAVRSLHSFRPVVVRRMVISYGSYHLNAWLVDLRRYLRRIPA